MIFHVFKTFHSENIAIFAILLRYFDISSVIGFVILFGYYIKVFERYCTGAVIPTCTYCPAPVSFMLCLDFGWFWLCQLSFILFFSMSVSEFHLIMVIALSVMWC